MCVCDVFLDVVYLLILFSNADHFDFFFALEGLGTPNFAKLLALVDALP